MRTFPIMAAAVLVCLLLTSCEVKSLHPLSSPKTAQVDQRLIGEWVDPQDKTLYRFSAVDAHWLHVKVIPGKSGGETESYNVFTTVIGNETYLNTLVQQHDQTPSRYYDLALYSISGGDVLQMRTLSDDATAAAVRSGKLKGKVDELYDHSQPRPLHPEVNVTLYDTSEDMLKYVESTNIYVLFGGKMRPLQRVTKAVD